MTRATRLAGTAKPMPFEPPDRLRIAVFTPTSRPCMSTRAPPELPGSIAASFTQESLAEMGSVSTTSEAVLAGSVGFSDEEIRSFEENGFVIVRGLGSDESPRG